MKTMETKLVKNIEEIIENKIPNNLSVENTSSSSKPKKYTEILGVDSTIIFERNSDMKLIDQEFEKNKNLKNIINYF